eukprot:s2457_g5.t3
MGVCSQRICRPRARLWGGAARRSKAKRAAELDGVGCNAAKFPQVEQRQATLIDLRLHPALLLPHRGLFPYHMPIVLRVSYGSCQT